MALMTSGLDDVVAAETRLSHVDGQKGDLVIAGLPLAALAENHDFESVCARLWTAAGEETARSEAADAIGRAREAAYGHVPALIDAARKLPVVEGLRAGLALLPDAHDLDTKARLVGAAGVFTAALCRAKRGEERVAPDPSLGHAEDVLRMVSGHAPDRGLTKALDTYLTTVSDHGMNASTFAARVIASTEAGMISAAVGGLCALKGPLHGGAPGPVLDMLDAIGDEANIDRWLDDALGRGERLMGFGHRIYRTRDPRADVLKSAVKTLKSGNNRIAFAEAVEEAALKKLAEHRPGRPLDTNVEFYTALLLEAAGFPREAFTAVFACGRVAGWTAHVIEQEHHGRLIRPQSVYLGEGLGEAA